MAKKTKEIIYATEIFLKQLDDILGMYEKQ